VPPACPFVEGSIGDPPILALCRCEGPVPHRPCRSFADGVRDSCGGEVR